AVGVPVAVGVAPGSVAAGLVAVVAGAEGSGVGEFGVSAGPPWVGVVVVGGGARSRATDIGPWCRGSPASRAASRAAPVNTRARRPKLVAHFLGIDENELPPNWTYYDMIDADGREISVKHSVGPSPKFAIARREWAWDSRLRQARRETEGWYGGMGLAQHWCHAYVFAWLPAGDAQPPLDDILDPDSWRFGAGSRADMYRQIASPAAKSIGLGGLQRIVDFVPGSQLRSVVSTFPLDIEWQIGRLVERHEVAPAGCQSGACDAGRRSARSALTRSRR
ncbi:MAG: hypothetical protein M3492_01970, partial [Actinomycetota bacterium]|nr:hypothetical protein [Actinomycetota bacterium]